MPLSCSSTSVSGRATWIAPPPRPRGEDPQLGAAHVLSARCSPVPVRAIGERPVHRQPRALAARRRQHVAPGVTNCT